jgi:hypothetical protein
VVGLALLNLLQCGGQDTVDAPPSPERRLPTTPPQADACGPVSFRKSASPAVLSLGGSCISIAIADPAGRPFVRDIGSSVAGASRPALVGARLGTQGSFSSESGRAAHDDSRPMTGDSLVEDVATTLRYYAAQNGSARVGRLLVCGGVPAAQESLELLRTRVNFEVRPWNPLTDCGLRIAAGGLKNAKDDPPPWYGPSLAVAAGLALRSL